jgi:hypothetical protein
MSRSSEKEYPPNIFIGVKYTSNPQTCKSVYAKKYISESLKNLLSGAP